MTLKLRNIHLLFVTIFIMQMVSSCSEQPNRSELTQSIAFELQDETASQTSITDPRNKKMIEILTNRLNKFGYPNIIDCDTVNGSYTLLLPPKADLDIAKRLISSCGKLGIWETLAMEEIMDYMKNDTLLYYNKYIVVASTDTAKLATTIRSFLSKARWDDKKILWHKKLTKGKGHTFQLHIVKPFSTDKQPVITNKHIKEISPRNDHGYWSIAITLDEAGSIRFEDATERNLGKPMAIAIDDWVYSAPIVNAKITGGSIEITGNFEKEDIDELSAILSYEELPLTVKIK